MNLKVGQTVELTDKNIKGKIAYIGLTKFANGKWIGVELFEKKGKNNGTIEGVTYFSCAPNFGIFVKFNSPTIKVIADDISGSNSSIASSISSNTQSTSSKVKRPSAFGSKNSINTPLIDKNESSLPKLSKRFPSNQTLSNQNEMQSSTGSIESKNIPIATTTLKPISRPTQSNLDVKTMATKITASITQSNPPKVNNENVDLLKTEIKDLNEKVESLKKKLTDEKEKLKDYEKTKIHLQQLQEFKKQITESHAELNRQLQQAKKESKEAIEEKLRHVDEMKDLSETAEIATLDKEMAEEKYEILVKEHELLKEKLDETSIDYELLKSRIEQHGTGAVANDHQLEQLENQNKRLREACLKLKNLSEYEKNEFQKLKKEFDVLINEKSFLEKNKEKAQEEIQNLENQVTDLKEQIDFNLGAQEMVEILTEKNLQQEDKIKELEENILELEEIHEINEQLQETARETELELKEELDTMVVKLNEMEKKYEESQENLAEYESTTQKLREIVAKLKNENDQLIVKNTNDLSNFEEEKQKISQAENMQFKMRIVEAKVFSRAIEMDLRRLEVSQANEYIKYLSMFMPESFFIQGGDNDAIQILLFAPRMIFKLHIISRQILTKFDVVTDIDDKIIGVYLNQENEIIDQQLFVRKLLFLINSIEFALEQFLDALETCPLELYLKIASLLPELSIHEKVIDNCIDLLKKDQFDQTISLEGYDKVLNYFISIFTTHLLDAKVHNSCKMLSNFILMLQQTISVIHFDALIIKNCIDLSKDTKFDFFTKLSNKLNEIKESSKKIKRRLAGDQKIKLTLNIEQEVRECSFEVNKIVSLFNNLRDKIFKECKEKKKQSNNDEEFTFLSLDTFLKQISNLGGIQYIDDNMLNILNLCKQLISGLQQGDYDEENVNSLTQEEQLYSINSLASLDVKNPLKQRAEYIKAQSGQVNDLKIKLESEQAELNKLSKLLKTKNEDWQEMKIRKEMSERKLQMASRESDERIARLQNELDDLTNTLKRKEKENEETMNHLQADIESLESEKGDLKEKIKQLSRKNMEGINRSSATSITNTSSANNTSLNNLSSNISLTTSNLSAIEVSYINQMKILKKALKETNEKLYKLKCKSSLSQFKELKFNKSKPLWLLKLKNNSENQDENKENLKDNYNLELLELLKKIRNLEKETTIAVIEENKIDCKKSLVLQLKEQNLMKKIIEEKYKNLQEDVKAFKLKYFDCIGNDLDNLLNDSTNQNESNKFLAAKIEIEKKLPVNQNVFSFEITLDQLKQIHQKIF